MVVVFSGREPGPACRAVPHGAKVAPPHGPSRHGMQLHGPSRHGMQLQARFHARSAIYSQDMRRSGRDTCNDARTATPIEPAPTRLDASNTFMCTAPNKRAHGYSVALQPVPAP